MLVKIQLSTRKLSLATLYSIPASSLHSHSHCFKLFDRNEFACSRTSYKIRGVQPFGVLGHTGRRVVVLGHTLNTQTQSKTKKPS